jgi:hypothetical protein
MADSLRLKDAGIKMSSVSYMKGIDEIESIMDE